MGVDHLTVTAAFPLGFPPVPLCFLHQHLPGRPPHPGERHREDVCLCDEASSMDVGTQADHVDG